MKITSKILQRADVILFLFITLLAIFKGQATVFYIVYLFWFQEFIRTMIDLSYLLIKKKRSTEKILEIRSAFSNFFLMFIYWVFIVVTFGLILNFSNKNLLRENILIFLFRNWYFNSSLLLFAIQHLIYRFSLKNKEVSIVVFNRRHIILHLSILLGAVVQHFLVPKLPIDQNAWMSVFVILPFLLLKLFLDRDYETSKEDNK